MIFNLYRPFLYTVDSINHSVHTINRDKLALELARAKTNDLQNSGQKNEHHQSDSRKPSISGFVDDIRAFQHQSGTSSLSLFLFILQITTILLLMLCAMINSLGPKRRAMIADEHAHPAVKHIEYIFYLDFFHRYSSSALYNQFVMLLLCQAFILRVKDFFIRLNTARVNKQKYTKLNIIQLYIGYLYTFYGTWSEWKHFLWNSLSHKCHAETCLNEARFKEMKKLSEELRFSSRLDKIYVLNQIEFCNCYAGFDFKLNELDKVTSDQIIDPPGKFALQINKRTPYTPKPLHQMDPVSLYQMTLIYVASYIGGFALMIIILAQLWYIELIAHGLDWHSSWMPSLSDVYATMQDLPSMLRLLEAFVSFCFILSNSHDCGLLILSSFACHSRGQKVIHLINQQASYLNKHSRVFGATPEQPDREAHDQMRARRNSDSNKVKTRRGSILPIKPTSLDIAQEYVRELNSNIRYILDLVKVLCAELDDLKSYFTFYLNCGVFFGAIGSTLVYSGLSRVTIFNERMLIYQAAIIPAVPILFASILGATSEREVSV